MVIPAGAGPQPMPRAAIATKYGVPPDAVRRWTADPTFPKPASKGRWAPDHVDAWLEVNHPAVWAAGRTEENPLQLPVGDDHDLLTAADFGAVMSLVRGHPVDAKSIRSYEARGRVPLADRRPEDGQEPAVTGPRWYRKTVNETALRPQKLPVGRREITSPTT